MLQILRSSPVLIGSIVFVIIVTLVCGVVALMMRHAGQSLRPIVWFAGFMTLIAVPQIVYHAWSAVLLHRAEQPLMAALDVLAQPYPGIEARAAAIRTLFGADTDPAFVQDARQTFGDALAGADVARLAIFPNGETALIARLPGASAATDAWVAWLRVTGLNQRGEGDSKRGYSVKRPAGDRVHARPTGSLLGVWTGADDEAISRRMVAGGFQPQPRALPFSNTTMALVLAIYLLLIVLYFFKGTSWAGMKITRIILITGATLALSQCGSLRKLSPYEVWRSANV